jgi:hypothetical protein
VNGWLILVAWALGWVTAARPSMRRTMLQKVCSKCQGGWLCDCNGEPRRVVRGARWERTGADVAWSVWIAAWWPVWLAFSTIRFGLRRLGRGVTQAVIRATPLTGPELERRVAEQVKEIDRLSKQIGATPP